MHQTAGLAACLTLLLGASASAQTTFITNDESDFSVDLLWLSGGQSQIAQPFRAGSLSAEETNANTAWLVTEVRVRLNFDNTRRIPPASLCKHFRDSGGGRLPCSEQADWHILGRSGHQIYAPWIPHQQQGDKVARIALGWAARRGGCAGADYGFHILHELGGLGFTGQVEGAGL